MDDAAYRIHRHNYENQFTIYSNSLWENEYISWGAKALLAYMLSRPKDWVIYRSQLASIYKGESRGNGKTAIDTFFNELIEFGFILYTPKDKETGKFIHRYDVYPEPQDFQKKIPKPVKLQMGSTQNGLKRGQQRKDSYPRNEEENKTEAFCCSSLSEKFKELEIPLDVKLRVCEEHPEKIDVLINRIKNWDNRESDLKALWAILKNWDSWEDPKTQNDVTSQNEAFLEKSKLKDGKTICNYKIDIGKRTQGGYISFTNANVYFEFMLNDKDFIKNLKEFCKNRLDLNI